MNTGNLGEAPVRNCAETNKSRFYIVSKFAIDSLFASGQVGGWLVGNTS